jgi:hypothetical protein
MRLPQKDLMEVISAADKWRADLPGGGLAKKA